MPGIWRLGLRALPFSSAPANLTLWVITDRNKDRVADEVKRFAPTISFKIPNGVCFSKDGFLFVVEQNRVLTFPAAEFFYESPDVAVGEVVPQGKLIPPEEESYNHTARVCDVGPDNKLYISLGQPFNVPPPEKADLYKQGRYRWHHPHGPERQEP